MKKLLLSLPAFLLSAASMAQAGTLDPSFNPTDSGLGLGDGANGFTYFSIPQPDGTIYMGGSHNTYNGVTCNRLALLNPDGTINGSFTAPAGTNNQIATGLIQPDGKLLIGGSFTQYGAASRNAIARVNTDGSNDATFNPGTGANGFVLGLALQPDGKIIIVGQFTSYNGTARNRIARLNADGSLDLTFDPGTGINGNAMDILLRPDGRIFVCGNFVDYNGVLRRNVAQINADGTLDLTFDPGTGATLSPVNGATLQPDGKVIITGDFSAYDGTPRNRIARINTDGSNDAGFDPSGGANANIIKSALQPDGKILLTGTFTLFDGNSSNCIARVNDDGSYDSSYNIGAGATAFTQHVALQTDGKAIYCGDFTALGATQSIRVGRLNTDGSADTTFNPGNGSNGGTVNAIAIQSDNKIIHGGAFFGHNGSGTNRIARLTYGGEFDATYNTGSGASATVFAIAVQADDKAVIGGGFTFYSGTGRNRVARVNTDGSLDLTFAPGTGANNNVRAIAVQPDGKIIIGGDFTSYNGTVINRLARLNADGTLDGTFTPGTAANNSIRTIAMQPDGKIIIGGGFTNYNGTAINRIARLNTDGTLDGTFAVGSGANNFVFDSELQPDGKVLIAGLFTSYNGTGRNFIARLNADGTLDGTFIIGTGAGAQVNAIALQADGKVLIGGQFTVFNGTARNRIARLLSTGGLDVAYNPGTGAANTINSLCLQNNEKLLIGGDFFSYNGTGRNRIARILSDCTDTFNTINPSACNSFTHNGDTYTESGSYTQFLVNVAGCDSILTINLTIEVPACYDPFALNYDPFAPCGGGVCIYEPTPTFISAQPFPTCTPTAGVTAIPGASVLPGLGPNGGDPDDDLYYAFTTNCEGAVKVMVNGTGINAVLEFYDSSYNFLSAVDADATVGGQEILFIDGLAPATYVVRVYDHSTGVTGAFDICVTSLCSTRGSSPYPSLTYDACDVYKCDYIAAASGYEWSFFGTTTLETLTYSQNSNYTFLTLSSLTGGTLTYGESYDVTIGAVYNDIDLGLVTVYGISTDPCVMNASPGSELAAAYVGGTYQLNALVKSTISCNADGYVWRLTPLAESPLADHTVMGSTFLTLCNVSGILPGKTYDVEVAVIYGGTQYAFGPGLQFSTAAYVPVVLRAQDNCSNAGAVTLSYTIFTNQNRPCAKDYTWEFTPLPSGLPIYHKKGSGVRTVKLSTVAGLVPGTDYTVRVKAEYGSFTGYHPLTGEPQYDFVTAYGASDTICLVGPASEQTEEVAANESDQATMFSVFPVPFNQNLTVAALFDNHQTQATVHFNDLTGRTVWSGASMLTNGLLNETFNIGSGLASGTYVLIIRSGEKELRQSVVVAH